MKEIIDKIKPKKAEREKFKLVSNSFLKKLKIKDAQVVLGGSGAKDTWLSGNHDVDVFVRFDYKKYSTHSMELSDILGKQLKKIFKGIRIKRLHGSRDYFQFKHENYVFEIIPILKISKAEKALNITDISPLHSVWVNKHTKRIKDDVRLAKRFCRANHLYGAESYLAGFSGYVLEILVAHYGSFEKLLKASLKWKAKDIVDPEKYYRKKMALFHLNQSKLQSPLIVVDPVDKSRNAAAALSLDKFNAFKKLARTYLKNPKMDYFETKEIKFLRLKEKAQKKKWSLVYIEFLPKSGKEDVVGAKLLKVYEYLKKELDKFGMKNCGWQWRKMCFMVKKKELATYEIREGPPLKMKDYVKDFKKKNKNTYVKGGKIYAKIKVKYPKLDKSVKALLKDEYVKERIKGIKKIELVTI